MKTWLQLKNIKKNIFSFPLIYEIMNLYVRCIPNIEQKKTLCFIYLF
jgi:hypothetical protein